MIPFVVRHVNTKKLFTVHEIGFSVVLSSVDTGEFYNINLDMFVKEYVFYKMKELVIWTKKSIGD